MGKYCRRMDSENRVCPYCGNANPIYREVLVPGAIRVDDEHNRCVECHKLFHTHVETTVQITTSPDCVLNGEEHEWYCVWRLLGRDTQLCKVCVTRRSKDTDSPNVEESWKINQ